MLMMYNIMIAIILECLYYCCYREKITTDKIIDHIEKLADHEIDYIMNKFNHISCKRIKCC